VSVGRRRFDLVVFDLDGTLVAHDEPIWATLHRELGSDPVRRKEALRRGLAGELPYDAWFAHDITLLAEAGATRAAILAVIDRLALTPGAEVLLAALHDAGVRLAVLSGGLDLVADRHLPRGVPIEVHANRFHFDADGVLVGGTATRFDRAHKATGIVHLAERFAVPLPRVAFVGNGANDIEAARAAGFAIAWNDAPPELRAASHAYVGGPDLCALVPLLLAVG